MSYFNKIDVKNLQRGAFGETITASLTPIVQAAAQYNYIDGRLETYTASGGTTTASNEEYVCTTGTTLGAYGVIRSKEAVIYRPGQGVVGRITARFTTGVASSLQLAGLFTSTDGFYVGYNGTTFSIMHEYGGALEARLLTLTAGASGSESVTIVVDDDSHTFNVTSGTAAFNAKEIAAELNANIAGWDFTQNGDTVCGNAINIGAATGTFSFTNNAGGGTCAASWSTITTGAASTRDSVAQASWNGETLPFTLDPTQGNVYQITYQYLGYGAIKFYVEDPETGFMVLMHTIQWANANTTTSVGNPSMKLGWAAASLGSTTDLTTAGGSLGLFVEGEISPAFGARSVNNTKNIGTTLTNIVTLRNRRLYQGKANQGHIGSDLLSLTNDATKPAIFEIYRNTTLGGDPNYTYIDEDASITEYDTAGTTLTGGVLIGSFSVGRQSGKDVDLSTISKNLLPNETITIAGKVISGSGGDLTAAIIWEEDY